tara:strand:- start:6648 stop:7841 length:1194 start_codon:yes stop_codon:yes gene_type:complete
MSHYNATSSANLLGLSSIVNQNTINKDINLKNAELDFLSDISSHSNYNTNGNTEIYNKDIKDIAAEIGIDVDNISLLLDNNGKKNNRNDDDDDRRRYNNDNDRKRDDDNDRKRDDDNDRRRDDDYDDRRRDDDYDKSNVSLNKKSEKLVNIYDTINNEKQKQYNNDYESHVSRKSNNQRNDFPSLQQRFNIRAEQRENRNNNTKNEQYRHDVFSNVLHNIKPNAEYTHDIYTEELKNKKSMILEQIQLLILLLKEENEDISNIPEVSENDTIERLDHIYKILKIKKDRNQFSTLGEEIIMFCVHLLESFFDGERVIFGRFQPDLTGWHNSVAVKLRKMKYETSTVISDLVQTYNISYGTRLAIELIPSLFLYSKMKSTCKKKYAKNDLADNLSNIDI